MSYKNEKKWESYYKKKPQKKKKIEKKNLKIKKLKMRNE
jgi:hypothetical protein